MRKRLFALADKLRRSDFIKLADRFDEIAEKGTDSEIAELVEIFKA